MSRTVGLGWQSALLCTLRWGATSSAQGNQERARKYHQSSSAISGTVAPPRRDGCKIRSPAFGSAYPRGRCFASVATNEGIAVGFRLSRSPKTPRHDEAHALLGPGSYADPVVQPVELFDNILTNSEEPRRPARRIQSLSERVRPSLSATLRSLASVFLKSPSTLQKRVLLMF